jgi:glycosyltransferase involved in cell wall biosynthesis
MPLQEICHDLATQAARLVLIELPFDYAQDTRPRLTVWTNGRVTRTWRSRLRTPSGPPGYVRDVLQTTWWGLLNGPFDLAIAADNLNTLACLALRRLGWLRRVIFYTIDYVPQRFDSRLLNSVYHWCDRRAVHNADVVWNLTVAMMEGRRTYGGIDPASAAPQLVVPIGTRRQVPSASAETSRTLVFMGHLIAKQGVQLAIEAMPALLAIVPKARLLIIGGGPFETDLRALAEKLDLGDAVRFTGRVEKLEKVREMMAAGALAVAPYSRDLDSWTAFADPGKIKNYLGCSLPVLTTDVAPIARELEDRGCGVVIPYDAGALAAKAGELLTDLPRLRAMRAAAWRMAEELEWGHILQRAFAETALAFKAGRLKPKS